VQVPAEYLLNAFEEISRLPQMGELFNIPPAVAQANVMLIHIKRWKVLWIGAIEVDPVTENKHVQNNRPCLGNSEVPADPVTKLLN